MKLADYLDADKLSEHINNRVINAQHHHYAPLRIYNYGQKAQFDGIWDDVTVKCRGLIVNESTGEVVARPFQKFFNLGTAWRPETNIENLPAVLPEITEKWPKINSLCPSQYNPCRCTGTNCLAAMEQLPYWTCADPTRILLNSVDGKQHHCVKF